MADIRINSLPSTATSFNTDDYIAIDGASGGTRKMLAATLPLTDVTLGGSSGPSVKSTLSARAPRQGLVFNGTDGGSATMGSSIGASSATIDLILDIPSSNPSASRGVFTVGPNSVSANYANTLHAELRTDGKLWVNLSGATTSDYRMVESSSSLVSLYGGKRVRLTVVRDAAAATLAVYVNAVALTTAETTGGTAPAWSGSVTGTYFVPGRISASEIHVGYFSLVGFYNRALSASEVVSLYEAGVPSGADYGAIGGNATNSSIVTGADSNFSSDTGNWAVALGSKTISGGTLQLTDGSSVYYSPATAVIPVGKKVRFTVTVSSITGGNARYYNGSSYVNFASSAGTYTVEFTALAATRFYLSVAGGNAVFDDYTAFWLGLLLAPDAAQAGGGLVWYDTSGNAANITLPASGVSWNVPFGNNIAASGTNQNITLTPSGTGSVVANTASGASIFLQRAGTLIGSVVVAGVNEFALSAAAGKVTNLYANGYGAVGLSILANSNVLVGKTIDSANGRLQLAESTASTGGIGFGPETYLFRAAPANLRLDASTGDVQFQIAKQGTLNAQFLVDGAALYLNTAQAGMKLILSSGAGVEALRLDSSQNATFAGNITVDKATPAILVKRGANTQNGQLQFATGASGDFAIGNRGTSDSDLHIYNYGLSADAVTISKNTSDATFAGRSSATTAYGTAKSVTVDFATSTATNVTRTFTVTIPSPGLAGTFLLEVGVYGNGATGLGSLLVKGYGYFGSTSLYDATEISKVSTGNVTVSSITKGNGSFTFTVLDTTSSALVAVKYSQTSDAAITTLPTITSA